jgi:hypothetical protein
MVPLRVYSVKDIGGYLHALVEWAENSDGIKPDDSYVLSDLLVDHYPKPLIAFYETKIKFIKKK